MNRWIAILVVVVMVAIAIAAMERPDFFPGGVDAARLIWLLLALLLVSGAAYGFREFRRSGRTAIASLLIWAAIILAIVGLYNVFN